MGLTKLHGFAKEENFQRAIFSGRNMNLRVATAIKQFELMA